MSVSVVSAGAMNVKDVGSTSIAEEATTSTVLFTLLFPRSYSSGIG
jgi:hypothetical protein